MVALFKFKICIFIALLCSGLGYEDFKYPKNIAELTTNNFNETVMESIDIWIVAFFAPWCPYCRRLMPKYQEVADALEGTVKIGAVNGDKYKKLMKRFNVSGFPSVFIFGLDKHNPKEYKGKNAKKLIATALKIVKGDIMNWEELEREEAKIGDINLMTKHHDIIQITSEESFLMPCEEAEVCVISFLPDLALCPPDCRNNIFNSIYRAKKHFANKNWHWLWAEEKTQTELETYLLLDGSKYPVISAYVFERKRCANYFGEFTTKSIYTFLHQLAQDIVKTKLVRSPTLPDINEVDPWIEEEEDENEEDLSIKHFEL